MEHNIDQATKNYTIFCDLDGTLWEQGDPTEIAKPGYQPKIIHGTVDKIREWDSKGFKICVMLQSSSFLMLVLFMINW